MNAFAVAPSPTKQSDKQTKPGPIQSGQPILSTQPSSFPLEILGASSPYPSHPVSKPLSCFLVSVFDSGILRLWVLYCRGLRDCKAHWRHGAADIEQRLHWTALVTVQIISFRTWTVGQLHSHRVGRYKQWMKLT